jgi:hypothetical protein
VASREHLPIRLLVCIIAGVIIGAGAAHYAVWAETPGPGPPPGDFVTPATTTFKVFGLTVGQSTGPWSESGARFSRFHNIVSAGFLIAGLLAGVVVWAVLFRGHAAGTAQRGDAADPPQAGCRS